MQFGNFYEGKRILLTGHTGFKGSWLAEWLLSLGAEVYGYALDPQPHETLFGQLDLGGRIAADTRADLSDRAALSRAVEEASPDVVFHLAAQPLVRLSYEVPVETFATNVMGTVHLMEAVRQWGGECSVVCVTTDKCYDNREWLHAYREVDALGGRDPYSASKGAAEIAIAAYRDSFFASGGVRLASARAGNVIGGGDWALDRIVPDCVRSLRAQEEVPVRNRVATRPWQHVLEPLGGYLHLAARLAGEGGAAELQSAFNFGPSLSSNRSVAELVECLLEHLPGTWRDASDPDAVHEASKLNLCTDKAFHLLDWSPAWTFEETVAETARWYLAEGRGADLRELTGAQIREYAAKARGLGVAWASGEDRPEPASKT